MAEENEGQSESTADDKPTPPPPPPPENVDSVREASGGTSKPSEDGSATKTGSDGKDK